MRNRNGIARVVAALILTTLALTPIVVAAPGARTASNGAVDGQVDLNRAGIDELLTLPGVGQTIAERIVAWRDEHGPFRRVEDLLKVKGIGERSFEKLRPHVTVKANGK